MIIYSVMFLIGFLCAWVSLVDIIKGRKPTLSAFFAVFNIALMIYWAIQIYAL